MILGNTAHTVRVAMSHLHSLLWSFLKTFSLPWQPNDGYARVVSCSHLKHAFTSGLHQRIPVYPDVQYMVVYQCIVAEANSTAFFVDGSSMSNLQVCWYQTGILSLCHVKHIMGQVCQAQLELHERCYFNPSCWHNLCLLLAQLHSSRPLACTEILW